MFFKPKKITSFRSLTFSEFGMRHATFIEATSDGEYTVIFYYPTTRPRDGEEPKIKVSIPTGKMLELLNEYGILSWDGFDGDRPRGVLDGKTFSLKASVNGGREINARGDQRFPRKYSEFTCELYKLLGRR